MFDQHNYLKMAISHIKFFFIAFITYFNLTSAVKIIFF